MDFFPLIRLNESKIRKEWVSEVNKHLFLPLTGVD